MEVAEVPRTLLRHTAMRPAACPNCGRAFKDTSSVLKHMNHRYSSCHRWFQRTPPETSPPPQHPPDTHAPQQSRYFPGSGHIFDMGPGFLSWFHNGEYAEARTLNPYFPFLSQDEWELAAFLSCSGLSMKLIDNFLSLSIVSTPGYR